MTIIYNDWDITKRHAEVVEELLPPTLRRPQVVMNIPGFFNGRIGKDFKAGVYLMPLESKIGTVFSNMHDVNHISLLVAGTGITSNQSGDAPPLMKLAQAIRTAFASRRIIKLAVNSIAAKKWEAMIWTRKCHENWMSCSSFSQAAFERTALNRADPKPGIAPVIE